MLSILSKFATFLSGNKIQIARMKDLPTVVQGHLILVVCPLWLMTIYHLYFKINIFKNYVQNFINSKNYTSTKMKIR